MQYIVVLATAVFGSGSYVLIESDFGNQILAKILVGIALVGFIGGCVWRVSHIQRDRRSGPDLD
jgi:hypothetical protein